MIVSRSFWAFLQVWIGLLTAMQFVAPALAAATLVQTLGSEF